MRDGNETEMEKGTDSHWIVRGSIEAWEEVGTERERRPVHSVDDARNEISLLNEKLNLIYSAVSDARLESTGSRTNVIRGHELKEQQGHDNEVSTPRRLNPRMATVIV
jgi:hypothetical protein